MEISCSVQLQLKEEILMTVQHRLNIYVSILLIFKVFVYLNLIYMKIAAILNL